MFIFSDGICNVQTCKWLQMSVWTYFPLLLPPHPPFSFYSCWFPGEPSACLETGGSKEETTTTTTTTNILIFVFKEPQGRQTNKGAKIHPPAANLKSGKERSNSPQPAPGLHPRRLPHPGAGGRGAISSGAGGRCPPGRGHSSGQLGRPPPASGSTSQGLFICLPLPGAGTKRGGCAFNDSVIFPPPIEDK